MPDARRQRAELGPPDEVRLPPHSVEAEQGVIGSIFLAPEESLATCERQRVQAEWFYDLRQRGMWQTLWNMRAEGKHIDLITVQQRLKDHGHLEAVGGLTYLASMPDAVPSAANIQYYLDILRDKWVLRRMVGECLDTVKHAYDFTGSVEALVEGQRAKFDQFAQEHVNPTIASSLLKPAAHFAEIIFDRWFGEGKAEEEPGLRLPQTAFGDFPFRIRLKEMTLVLGESGQGKTTLLSYIVLHLMSQGMKAVVASMEMAPETLLEMLLQQLLGLKRCVDTEAGRLLFRDAVTWLNGRCEILDFRGIIQHRQLLDEFKRAADRGFTLFSVDNLNKLGVMEDDMAGHGQMANDFFGFAVSAGVHLFMVNHLNKAGASRGSLRWRDVTDNEVKVEMNKKKWDKLGPGFMALRDKTITHDEFTRTYEEELKAHDGNFKLTKQRFPATRQNGARTLWFLLKGLQYANHGEPLPEHGVNWLERWKTTA